MFYYSLIFAVVVLGLALYAARREPHSLRWHGFAFAGGILTLLSGSLVVFAMFILLVVALGVWRLTRERVRVFLPLAAVAVVIPYGYVGWKAAQEDTEYDRLREEFPLESLADRLPAQLYRQPQSPPNTDAAKRLGKFEYMIGDWSRTDRNSQFRSLHDRSVRTFINSPGFGVTRMTRTPISGDVLRQQDLDDTPSQPGSPARWGPEEPFEPVANADRDNVIAVHTAGVMDFVNSGGWGYVQGRDRVAGFLPHRFSSVPEVKTWQVQRIELVGLLKHPQPMVYLSDKLPAMAELSAANTPTRPLDKFETTGLEAILKGEDIFAAGRGEELRLVGALRATRQCVECHGGEYGNLLGAFSYTLRPVQR